MKSSTLALLCITLINVSACDDRAGTGTGTYTDPVLAKVGDSRIHQSQLNDMMEKIAPEVREQNSSQLETTILKGMVRTRALAAVAEKQLDDGEKAALDAKVQAYRDELLAKSFIEKNIKPRPVTIDAVKAYYEAHLQDYTTAGRVNFEYLVTTKNTLQDDVLASVLDAFTTAANLSDWKAYADQLNKQNLPVAYKSTSLTPDAINKSLRPQIDKLQPGEVSDVVYGDYIYITRLIERKPATTRPLHEVSVEIRKKLAPQKLKQELAQHIDRALQDISVEYYK